MSPLMSVATAGQSSGASVATLVPRTLQAAGPQGLAWWQWMALPVLLIGGLVVGRLFAVITRGLVMRVARRTPSPWDERWLERVSAGLTAVWAITVMAIGLPWLELPPAPWRVVSAALTAAGGIAVFWMLWRSVDTMIDLVVERSWAAGNASARSMLLVGGNLLKAAVIVMGAVATAAALGYPVATLIAGLGIGGIAFAFGAQKTIEHLFGSIALATDQPCRVGDTIRVDDVTGTVEYIGARSTRIRTPDRTLVTIPNGRLADSRIESYAARDRIRFAMTLSLAYGPTEGQMRGVLDGITQLLRAHPLIASDAPVANLAALTPGTMDVEILCWFATADYDAYRAARQEALLGILGVVEANGARPAGLPPPPVPAVPVLPAR